MNINIAVKLLTTRILEATNNDELHEINWEISRYYGRKELSWEQRTSLLKKLKLKLPTSNYCLDSNLD